MAKKLGSSTYVPEQEPVIRSFAAIVGKKEGGGPIGTCFDQVEPDAYFGQESWEKAESEMQKRTVQLALDKALIPTEQVDFICAGDLINQCIGSTYGLRDLNIPFLGLYGACSTMAEGLVVSSLLLSGGNGTRAVAVTSSHFSTAERQFRFPLSYGGQRTPSAQWTCTASGAVVLERSGDGPHVAAVTIGRIVDLGVTDANNMGAAMAPVSGGFRPYQKRSQLACGQEI